MKIDSKAADVLQWREFLTTSDDSTFFNIIHYYLGEIKTPYNKPNLIEQLSSFLRKTETKEKILSLLTKSDIQLLNAIHFLHQPTLQKINSFLQGQNASGKLENLQERLLIFASFSSNPEDAVYKINPLLKESLERIFCIENLIELENISPSSNTEYKPLLTSEIICALISYMNVNSSALKFSGQIKKRTEDDFIRIFGEQYLEALSIITSAFINLNVFLLDEGGFKINWSVLESLSSLELKDFLLYMCVASCGHFSKTTLSINAKILQELVLNLKDVECDFISCAKLYSVIKEMLIGEDSIQTRFSKMISGVDEYSLTIETLSQSIIENAIKLGIFNCVEIPNDYNPYQKISASQKYLTLFESQYCEKVLSIDSSFTISLLPGLKLSDLIILSKILELKTYDTVSTYTLTKSNFTKALSCNMTKTEIVSLLEKHSTYPLPQNFLALIDDWNASYNSALIYKGYVLKLDSESLKQNVCTNPILKPYILLELSSTVLLMDFKDDNEAEHLIVKSGINSTGAINSFKKDTGSVLRLTSVESENLELCKNFSGKKSSINEKAQHKLLKELEAVVNSMSLADFQKDEFLNRINKRVILFPEQLRVETVKYEMNEAGGMNYTGKIHLIEKSLEGEWYLSITAENEEEEILIKPVSLTDKTSEAVLYGIEVHSGIEKKIRVSLISRIKKIHPILID